MENLTKNSLLVLCLFLHFNSKALAFEKPSWVEQLPKDDESYRYYIGRCSESFSEAEAFTHATINAREQAIAQNFGVYTQIRTENYQSVDTSLSTQNSEAISQQVRLEEFEQVDFYKESVKDLKNIWVLFKYKKSAIDQEKSRLSKFKKERDESFQFMVSGNSEGAKINGTLEVVSSPPGAPVRIDGKSTIGDLELRTPLRLMGLFTAGKHTIEIDDPKYELVQKEIILYPGTTAKIDERLKRAYGEITIITDTVGATVFLGAKPIGTTPIEKNVHVMAENSASIEVRHPEMETYRTQVLVSRGEKKIEYVSLVARLSTISFSSDPRGASVEIDNIDKNKTTPTGQINIGRGTHGIKIFKSGYLPYYTTAYIKGGENLVLPNVKLEYIQTGTLVGIENFRSANLTLNGKYYSTSENELALSPGTYKLNISRIGYETYEDDIEIKKGKSRDISSISLKEMPAKKEEIFTEDLPKKVNYKRKAGEAKLYISFATFSNVTYINKKKSVVDAPGGVIGYQIWNRLAIEFGYFNINSNEQSLDNSHSEVVVHRRIEVARLGMPLTFIKSDWIANDTISLIPEAIQLTNNYTTEVKSSKYSIPDLTTKQIALGASIYYRSLSDNSNGMGLRIGSHTYSSPDKQSHSKAFSAGIEFVIGF